MDNCHPVGKKQKFSNHLRKLIHATWTKAELFKQLLIIVFKWSFVPLQCQFKLQISL